MERKNIVIAGAGFGGITTALTLAQESGRLRSEYNIMLVNKSPHHLYTPALYEIASVPRELAPNQSLRSSVLVPIADIIRELPIEFLLDEIKTIHREQKTLTLSKHGILPYEFLVLALGSETNYFNIPGLREESVPLKTFGDAVRLRNKIEDLVQKKMSLKIVVGGAGASGIELVAEFVNFVCTVQKLLPGRSVCSTEFVLIEATPEILPGFDQAVVTCAKNRLRALGINMRTNSLITEVKNNMIVLKDGTAEPYDIFIWTGGTKGPEILKTLSVPLSAKELVEVNEFLQVKGAEDRLFAIGDNATMFNQKTGKPLVGNVPVAEAEGKIVAKNIIRLIRGEKKRHFVPMQRYPFVLAVGEKYAVADLLFIRFSGYIGWIAKQLVELRYFLFILPFGKAIRMWLRSVLIARVND